MWGKHKHKPVLMIKNFYINKIIKILMLKIF